MTLNEHDFSFKTGRLTFTFSWQKCTTLTATCATFPSSDLIFVKVSIIALSIGSYRLAVSLHILLLTLEVFLQKDKEEDKILDEDDIILEIPVGIYDMTGKNAEYVSQQREVFNMVSYCFMPSQ